MYDVVTLGELLIDFTQNGYSSQGNGMFEANPGGAPGNVLAMLNRLGHKTAFIGKVGEDYFGHLLADTLKEVGIDTKGLVFDKDVRTTLALVHTFPDGDRDFSFYRNPGADMMLTPEEVPEEMFEGTRLFHFGTISMTDEPVRSATMRALELAKKHGCLISFDPNLRPPLWKSMDEARAQGALGIFNDKYGERVKVYTIGDVSKEICGGPHAGRTSELGRFKIKKEESSSSGVRRIKAVLIHE